jgi:HSP20 family protein
MAKLIKWDPFEEIERFFKEEFLPLPVFRFSSFPTDIYEKDNEIVVMMEVPGFKKDDLKIKVEEGYLVVEGEAKEKKEEKEEGRYWRREIRRESFRRVIPLPVEVEFERAKARLENGVLEIVLPKKPEASKDKGKEISIE